MCTSHNPSGCPGRIHTSCTTVHTFVCAAQAKVIQLANVFHAQFGLAPCTMHISMTMVYNTRARLCDSCFAAYRGVSPTAWNIYTSSPAEQWAFSCRLSTASIANIGTEQPLHRRTANIASRFSANVCLLSLACEHCLQIANWLGMSAIPALPTQLHSQLLWVSHCSVCNHVHAAVQHP